MRSLLFLLLKENLLRNSTPDIIKIWGGITHVGKITNIISLGGV